MKLQNFFATILTAAIFFAATASSNQTFAQDVKQPQALYKLTRWVEITESDDGIEFFKKDTTLEVSWGYRVGDYFCGL